MADIKITTNINSMNEGDANNLEFVYRHREQGETAWIESSSTANTEYTITGLPSSTTYECQVLATETLLNKSLETAIQNITTSAGSGGDITTGLIAHYTMQNIVGNILIDETGNYDGTIYGATQVAEGLSFDGVDDYVDIPISNNMPFTISYNISFSASSTTNSIIIDSGWWEEDASVHLYYIVSDYSISAGIRDGANFEQGSTRLNTIIPDQFHKVTFTVSDSEIKLYIDGVLEYSGTHMVPYVSDNDLRVGARITDSGSPLNGTIKEIHIYDRALSQAEIDLL